MSVSQIRPGAGAFTPSGGDGGVEARLAKLEAIAEHINLQISDIKTDLRELRNWALAAVLFILGSLATGYLRLSDRSDLINDKVSQVLLGVQQLADQAAKK